MSRIDFRRAVSRMSLVFAALAITVSTLWLAPPKAFGGTEQVLHSFTGGVDGQLPNAGVILDSAGNVYGATDDGGASFYGTVYQLSPASDGTYNYDLLFSFKPGSGLNNTQLHMDAAGNLYGVRGSAGSIGAGIVFEMSPNGDGTWSEKILYTSRGGTDGEYPVGGVVLDETGNLYGATVYGGDTKVCNGNGCGTIYELIHSSSGWTKQELYRFKGSGDGANPESEPTIDVAGNLYGTTYQQGLEAGGECPGGCGTVFKLSPTASIPWTETILHHFTGRDGSNPTEPVTLDAAGNVYVATTNGGNTEQNCPSAYGCGTVVELLASSNWAEKVLYSFSGSTDGWTPSSNLLIDSAGNVYGTTYSGGSGHWGEIFELSPGATGWSKTEIYSFTGLNDGADPDYPIAFDSAGRIYGVTYHGGQYGDGTVYQVTP